MSAAFLKKIKNELPIYFSWVLLVLGIMLRLAVFWENRNFTVDEANIARNIYERGYFALLSPLSYEQFAPKCFLIGLKAMTFFFGFSEFSLRMIPLLSSIISVVLFYQLLKKVVPARHIWYGLAFFSSSMILMRYASETKQYATDVAITIALLLLCFLKSPAKLKPLPFILFWSVAGTAAIWCSMPSVFILAGIWFYFFTLCRQQKGHWPGLFIVGGFWLLQFGLYYFLLLRQEISSPYLQQWHKGYFLQLCSDQPGSFAHNLDLLQNVFACISGGSVFALLVQCFLLIIGIGYLALHKRKELVLFVVPVLGLLLTCQFHFYTMLPRVVSFILPVLLVLVSYGFSFLMSSKLVIVQIAMVVVAFLDLDKFNQFQFLYRRYVSEEYTDGMKLARENKVYGSHFYVNELIVPVHLYYTHIHPDSAKWTDFKDARLLQWGHYEQEVAAMQGRNAVIYCWYMDDELKKHEAIYHEHFAKVEIMKPAGVTLYMLDGKRGQ